MHHLLYWGWLFCLKALNALNIIGSTALAQWKNLPITCCTIFDPLLTVVMLHYHLVQTTLLFHTLRVYLGMVTYAVSWVLGIENASVNAWHILLWIYTLFCFHNPSLRWVWCICIQSSLLWFCNTASRCSSDALHVFFLRILLQNHVPPKWMLQSSIDESIISQDCLVSICFLLIIF